MFSAFLFEEFLMLNGFFLGTLFSFGGLDFSIGDIDKEIV